MLACSGGHCCSQLLASPSSGTRSSRGSRPHRLPAFYDALVATHQGLLHVVRASLHARGRCAGRVPRGRRFFLFFFCFPCTWLVYSPHASHLVLCAAQHAHYYYYTSTLPRPTLNGPSLCRPIYIYKVAQPLHQQAAALTFFVIPISEISVVVVWSVEETIKQAPRHGALPQALLGRPPRPPAARGHRYTTPPPALHYCYIYIL